MGGNGNITVLNTNTSNRWIIIKLHKNQDRVMWRASATEMENHANTHCFGSNFRSISLTLEECTTSPFLPEYTEQVNRPIRTSVTSLELDSGEVIILKCGQGLWFGNILEK